MKRKFVVAMIASLMVIILSSCQLDNIFKWSSSSNILSSSSSIFDTSSITSSDSSTSNSSTTTSEPPVEHVIKITHNNQSNSLYVDETLQLSLLVDNLPYDGNDMYWSSSDNSIAIIDSTGLVRAIKEGNVNISVSLFIDEKLYDDSISLEILHIPVLPTSISLNVESIILNVDDTYQLTPTIYPENADNKSITYISNDTDIATISNDGLITALKGGKTSITATTINGLTAQVELVVHTPVVSFANIDSVTLDVGDIKTITANIRNYDNGTLTYSSSNSEIVSVNSQTGQIKALKHGTATISASITLNSFTYSDEYDAIVRDPSEYTSGLQFTISSDGTYYSVTGYNGANHNVTIPSIYNNLSVEEIADKAFYNNDTIKIVNIPYSIKTIGVQAFAGGCDYLEIINIPYNSQLTTIKKQAFESCDTLRSIRIPKTVSTIELNAFGYCFYGNFTIYCEATSKPSGWDDYWMGYPNIYDLPIIYWNASGIDRDNFVYLYSYDDLSKEYYIEITDYINESNVDSITIPHTINNFVVKSIGSRAFEDCNNINFILFEENCEINNIGDYAFLDCYLYYIIIPSSVQIIGEGAFENSSRVIYCEDSSIQTGWHENWNSSNILTIFNCHDFGKYNEENYYFNYLIVNDDVDAYAAIISFGLNSRTSVDVIIPSAINIDGGDIPVKLINEYLFYDFPEYIQSVFIPSSVGIITGRIFSSQSFSKIYCEILSEAEGWDDEWNYYDNPVVWGYIGISSSTDENHSNNYNLEYSVSKDFDGSKYITITKCNVDEGYYVYVDIPELFNIDGVDIPVKIIAENSFSNTDQIRGVNIPSSVTIIKTEAFRNCNYINFTIDFAENSKLEIIEDYAFAGCNFNNTFNIPSSVKSIGNYAFAGCNFSNTFNIPSSVKSIGNYAFEDCDFENISFGENSKLETLGINAFADCNSLTNIEIPKGVKTISAFNSCDNLETVTFEEGSQLESIAGFMNCLNLKNISIPDTVKRIENSAFEYCSSLTHVVFPSSLTYIGDRAFDGCNLSSLTLPEGLIYIGDYAFRNNKDISSITIPSTVTSIGSYAFYNCSNLLVSFKDNSKLETIGNYAFANCIDLRNISIPSTVTSIGEGAFSGCSNLKKITFSDDSQLENIGTRAFENCSSLEEIIIPVTVTYIGYYAFDGCNKLFIFTKLSREPVNWLSSWNSSYRPVVYEYYSKLSTISSDYLYALCQDKDGNFYITIYGYTGDENVLKISKYMYVTLEEYGRIKIQIKAIAENAFYYASGFEAIYIPDTIEDIGRYGIYGSGFLTIYCEVDNRQSGWDREWISYNYESKVKWGSFMTA